MAQDSRQVHLMRHGQVHNPDGILYGQLPGYGLSDLGLEMADRMAEYWSNFQLTHLRCSPLLRARETLAPTAALFPGLPITTDLRLIEAGNVFEGMEFGPSNRALRDPECCATCGTRSGPVGVSRTVRLLIGCAQRSPMQPRSPAQEGRRCFARTSSPFGWLAATPRASRWSTTQEDANVGWRL